MPYTVLYKETQKGGLASVEEAYRILQEKYAGKQSPSGDLAEDDNTIETASSTILAAALSPEFNGPFSCVKRADCIWITAGFVDQSGLFLRNCKPFETERYATDPVNAEKLWKLSEELVGENFSI